MVVLMIAQWFLWHYFHCEI